MTLDEFIAKKKAELDDYASNFEHETNEGMLIPESPTVADFEFSFSEWQKEI